MFLTGRTETLGGRAGRFPEPILLTPGPWVPQLISAIVYET